MDQSRRRKRLSLLDQALLPSNGLQIELLAQSPRLPANILRSPALLALLLALLPRQQSRSVLNGHGERSDNALNDVVHAAALGSPGRELDHVTLAQRVLRVVYQEFDFLLVVFPDVLVPLVRAVDHSDSTVHAADGDDSAGLSGGGIVAEQGGWVEGLGFGDGWRRGGGGDWWRADGFLCGFGRCERVVANALAESEDGRNGA